jgi:hypothetical protein
MHPPRPPAFGPGTQAFLWAIGLGGFVFIGMRAINISLGTSIVVSIVSAFVIFFAVRIYGDAAQPRSGPAGKET